MIEKSSLLDVSSLDLDRWETGGLFLLSSTGAKKKRTPSASAFLLPDLGNAWLDPMSLTHVGVDSLHEFGLRQKVHFKKILPLLASGINARIQSIT